LERLRRGRGFRAVAQIVLLSLTTLLAPPALPAASAAPSPAAPWRSAAPDAGAADADARVTPARAPLARAGVDRRLPAQARRIAPVPPPVRAAAPPPAAQAPGERAVGTRIPQGRIEDDPRLRRLPSARLPWLHAPGEALLAALAATPSAGDAPALAREATLPAGWSLVSVPLVAGNTQASSVFASLPSPPYVYDYVGGQTLGLGEPGFRTVVPGRAFWVLLRQPQTLSISGLAINPTLEARLPLASGWNTLATPWLSSVPWTDARVGVRVGSETAPLSEAVTRGWLDGSLYQYDAASGQFIGFAPNASPAGELRVWAGSALFASVAGELVLQPPPPDTQPPAISLTPAPVDGQAITAPTDIVGTVDDPNLAEWRLELAPTGTSAFTPFALGATPVTNGLLGTLDPTLLLNGQYQVRFVATDAFGQTSTIAWTVVVKDNLKVGNFSLSFVDLEVPLAGLPIRVTRTYDSRDKGRGDFGIGWRLELSNLRADENLKAGSDWQGTTSGGAFPTYCVVQARQHKATFTLPDGTVYEFEPTLTPQCQQLVPPEVVTLGWRPLPGTLGALESLDNDPQLLVAGGFPGPLDLLDLGTVDVADPDLYRLTLPDGRAFVVHQHNGLQSLTDLNGNQLVVGPGGITHSSGTGVAFTRDGLGRVTKITDPNSNVMTYAYDANGDLASFTDRENNATTFTYNGAHGLLTITDPLGRQPIRNDYDAGGRLIRHTDALGKTIEYTHDVDGRRETVTDRTGGVRVFEYDERGNVVSTVDPDGRVVQQTFDARGNRLSETDPNGNTTIWAYDAADNVTSLRDPAGNLTAFTYNAGGQPLTVTDALGRVATNAYDARGNLTSTTDPDGVVTSYVYDARGNVLSATVDVGGVPNVTSRNYDARGNLTREVDALGHATTYTYNANGDRLSESTTRTLPGGGVETLTRTHAYDRNGRLSRTTDPDGSFTRSVYDALGRRSESYDKLGRKTAYEYDAMGRLTRTVFPDLTSEESTWDGEGRRLTSRDRAGRVTRFEHDVAGRIVKATYPDGAVVVSTYDPGGRLLATTDASGRTTTYAYDAAGRRTRVRDALGHETLFGWDAVGNQTSVRDARGNLTTFEYDGRNRRVRTIFPDLTERATGHDELGRRTSESDQAGRTTQFVYDPAGRLTRVVDALGQATNYAYDEVGNRLAETDAAGHTTRYEYDRLRRVTRRVLPDGSAETRAYDGAGNLVARVDFAGRTSTYSYDSDDRLLGRTYPDGSSVGFTYAPTGPRLSATDARGTTTYAYDSRDRLVRLTCPDGRRLDYAYDGEGRRTALTAYVGAGLSVVLPAAFAYDAAGRLKRVTDPLGRPYDLGWDAAGNRATLAYPNGTTTTYAFDTLNRLVSLGTTHAATTTVVQAYTFTLGPAGNRTRIDEAGGVLRQYTYDDLYRLTGEGVGGPLAYTKAFSYDAVGNRLTQDTTGSGAPGTPTAGGGVGYTYDARNRLLAETGASAFSYAWDASGNLAARSGDAVYTWDFDERLLRVEKSDGTRVDHVYDADGNRVRTTLTPPGGAAQVVDYLVDTSGRLAHVVAETDGGGNLRAYYLRGAGDLLATLRPDGGGGWSTRFYHADGVGSIRALTDEAGAVTDTYVYTAFGELIEHNGADPQPYAFAGEPYDPNVAFQYHRARWLDPRLGRFVSMDPFPQQLADPAGLHAYLYARNAPLDLVDPTGLFGEFSLGGMLAVSAIIGILSSIAAIGYGLWNYNRTLPTVRGTAVHEAIFPFYRAVGFRCNAWIATSANPPIDRQRPDCRHHGPGPFSGDVYEIKPIGLLADGVAEVAYYIAILATRYPGVPWHEGLALLAPTPLRVPEFPYILFDLALPAPGVITYSPRPDYLEALKLGLSVFAVIIIILLLRSGVQNIRPAPGIPRPVPAPA
jgi:RHS repeat-associated protein